MDREVIQSTSSSLIGSSRLVCATVFAFHWSPPPPPPSSSFRRNNKPVTPLCSREYLLLHNVTILESCIYKSTDESGMWKEKHTKLSHFTQQNGRSEDISWLPRLKRILCSCFLSEQSLCCLDLRTSGKVLKGAACVREVLSPRPQKRQYSDKARNCSPTARNFRTTLRTVLPYINAALCCFLTTLAAG